MRISSLSFRLGLAFFVAAFSAGAQDLTELQQRNRLKVLSYNIRNGKGMDERADYQRTARAIRKYGADVVAVQEVDSATQRSNGR